MTTTEFNKQLTVLNGLFFGNAMRLTGNRHNAKDLMQETIMRAFASCHKFTEGTNFKAWVNTIMQNCFINEYRKHRNRSHVMQFMEDNMTVVLNQSVRNQGPAVIMMKELRNILDDLSDLNRVPFELFVDGFGYQEIAEQLDVPLGTVKSRIFFARKKLRDVISGHYGEQIRYAS
ncbi:MAG: sigma-70 family RNA polymerase sigma factor [Saprospiraceae bacterium]|nr:sigma-70 family RNA polymerase sigma factor [Saprospiraceae bacterium]